MTAVGTWTGQSPDHPLARADHMFRMAAVERLDLLNSCWMRLQAGPEKTHACDNIRIVAHKIAGVAASLGHSRLGLCAEEVERLCIAGDCLDDLRSALRELMSGLADLIED